MQIAVGLDQLEREMMAEGGLDSEDYLRFVAQDSGNVAVDGMFSIQVSKASTSFALQNHQQAAHAQLHMVCRY